MVSEELKGEWVLVVGAFLHLPGTCKGHAEVWKNDTILTMADTRPIMVDQLSKNCHRNL